MFFDYLMVPDALYRRRMSEWFDLTDRYESEEIEFRVNYYNKIKSTFIVPDKAVILG